LSVIQTKNSTVSHYTSQPNFPPSEKKGSLRKDTETVIHSDNAFATVAYLRITNAILVPKENSNIHLLTVPPLLENEFLRVQDKLQEEVDENFEWPNTDLNMDIVPIVNCSSSRVGNWVSVCNVQRCFSEPKQDMFISLEDEVEECFTILQGEFFKRPNRVHSSLSCHLEHLGRYQLNISDCTNINIFISSIDLFSRINIIYGKYFGTSPPSRTCVAVDLPHPIRVRLDCTAFIEPSPSARQALHVQGLSYWAPANIGPYSQAVVV